MRWLGAARCTYLRAPVQRPRHRYIQSLTFSLFWHATAAKPTSTTRQARTISPARAARRDREVGFSSCEGSGIPGENPSDSCFTPSPPLGRDTGCTELKDTRTAKAVRMTWRDGDAGFNAMSGGEVGWSHSMRKAGGHLLIRRRDLTCGLALTVVVRKKYSSEMTDYMGEGSQGSRLSLQSAMPDHTPTSHLLLQHGSTYTARL